MRITPENFLSRIVTTEDNGSVTTVYPHFIASKYDLILTFSKINDHYCVHENGTVVRYMQEAGLYGLFDKNRKVLEKVFGFVLANGVLRRAYARNDRVGYFDFFKNLIFLLNLDIVWPHLQTAERYDTDGYGLPDDGPAVGCAETLKKATRPQFFFEKESWFIASGICYSNSENGSAAVCMTEGDDGLLSLTDGDAQLPYRRAVFELLNESEDGFAVYGDLIQSVCDRYGLHFADGHIGTKSKPQTEVLLNRYFCFLQAAAVLSEVGASGLLCH